MYNCSLCVGVVEERLLWNPKKIDENEGNHLIMRMQLSEIRLFYF